MRRSALLLTAAALDAVIGDPESWPHPVRAFGFLIARGERVLLHPADTSSRKLFAGGLLTGAIVVVTYSVTDQMLRELRRANIPAADALELILAASCLAWRSLDAEAGSVLGALAAGDLPQARSRLSRIVGRDTAALDEAGISRAVIETLAESASDGFVAPLFYLALGGVPLAMAFKAASTMDSMIGHRDARYLHFGRAAARLDDAANLIPSRLTAVMLALVSGADAQRSLSVCICDGRKHASPNAGQPEAAIAGALGVRLGGPSTYAGGPHDAPLLGAEFPLPTAHEARRARVLVHRTALLAVCLACVATLVKRVQPR